MQWLSLIFVNTSKLHVSFWFGYIMTNCTQWATAYKSKKFFFLILMEVVPVKHELYNDFNTFPKDKIKKCS